VLTPEDVGNARARVVENRCLVAWVAAELARRQAQYAHALEHLAIETPQPDAVPAERAVRRLAEARALLDRLGIPPLPACLDLPGAAIRPAVVIEPLVAKG
jgi:hypothetical protein